MSAVKSRRNQSTGDEKSNRTGKLRRSQLTCMVRLLKQYVTMQYVALINSVQEMHMSLSDAFIPINTVYSRCLGYVSIRTKRQLLSNSIQ